MRIFLVGLIGIMATLLNDVPEVQGFTSLHLKLLSLINPLVLLVIAVLFGNKLVRRLGLKSVIMGDPKPEVDRKSWLLLLVPLFTFAMSTLVDIPTKGLSPDRPNPIASILYGGLTEEIISRWFAFSLMLFLARKFLSPSKALYAGLTISAALFAIAHMPATLAFYEPSILLVPKLLIPNMVFGIAAGWMFYRYSIEVAMLFHMASNTILEALIGAPSDAVLPNTLVIAASILYLAFPPKKPNAFWGLRLPIRQDSAFFKKVNEVGSIIALPIILIVLFLNH